MKKSNDETIPVLYGDTAAFMVMILHFKKMGATFYCVLIGDFEDIDGDLMLGFKTCEDAEAFAPTAKTWGAIRNNHILSVDETVESILN